MGLTMHQWDNGAFKDQSTAEPEPRVVNFGPEPTPLPYLDPSGGPAGTPPVDVTQTSAETHSYYPWQESQEVVGGSTSQSAAAVKGVGEEATLASSSGCRRCHVDCYSSSCDSPG